MSDLVNDSSEKKPVKKRIVRKIIKKKPVTGSDTGEVVVSEVLTPKDQSVLIEKSDTVPKRRIIKKRDVTRKVARETLDEVLGKKAVIVKEQEKPQEEAVIAAEEQVVSLHQDEQELAKPVPILKEETGEEAGEDIDSSRKIRRRVIKRKPAIKRVIKKKSVTRRLARETVAEMLGKKMEGEKETSGSKEPVSEMQSSSSVSAISRKKAVVAKKVPSGEMDRTTKEIPKPVAPPHVDIPDDWKEKKISSYKKKSKEKPEFSPLPKETLLYNRYTIIDVIHTDCYGSIYKAIDSKARDKATEIRAIKEIQYSLSECGCVSRMEEVMDMIKKISSFLQDIDYPGLVKIYDYFYDINEEKGARFFIVMEFIEGKTLEEVLQSYAKDKKSLSPKKMFQAIINICDTLFYLHNRKPFPIAFVDLKPSNIIISRDEKMKFINYGMGRIIINQSDFSYEYRGSLGYSAPEQKGVDFTNIKADIFAFGSVFYYLLTGINPEDNPYEFKSIKDTKPFISDKVEKFIFKCVSIHPEERPDIEKIRDTIRSFDFFELDTSTEDSKPLEDKKEIATKKRKEPLDKVSKKKAVEKSGGMSGTLIAVITAVIVIIIFILLKIFKIF